ncbi:MAG: nucleoside deaminase [Bacteroidales bacterium]|mgnify:FL=1|nr:nucleoside deaminase [Bacteroidales bacterium]
MTEDEQFMRLALNEAMDAYEADEVPVGAVVVLNGKVIARGHNLTETLKDVTAHAEMLAITAAANGLGAKYLKNCTLYVTLEPCIMCIGAIMHSQIDRLVYGAKDPKKGYTLLERDFLPKNLKVEHGVLAQECSQILKDFFQEKR